MNSILEILKLPGFHGNISVEEVEKELKTQGKETYVVRFSSSTVGAFVITTFSNKGKFNHIKVDAHPKGFVAEFKFQKKEGTEMKKFSAESLTKLVVDVVSFCNIKSEQPPSSFAWIFSRDFSDDLKLGFYGRTFVLE